MESMMSDEGQGVNDSGTSSDWADLPWEILTNILSRLTLDQRWTGPMLVCRSWLRACKEPSLCCVFDLEPRFRSTSNSARWWSPEFERRMDSMLRSVVDWSEGNLRVIRVRHCTDGALSYAAERCPQLQVLSIKSCPNVTDASMAKVAFRCSKLEELDISYCYEISHETLVVIGRNCPELKVLKRNLMNCVTSQDAGFIPQEYLANCPQDGDSEANAIGKQMPRLKHLELRFSKLSARGLGLICEGCQSLEHLDVFGCVNLTSRDIAYATSCLKNLKEIKRPDLQAPRSGFLTQRYGHWRLYDERFQTDAFRI